MKTTLIRHRAVATLVGATCALLTALWAGCLQPVVPSSAPAASKTSITVTSAAVEPAASTADVAAAQAKKSEDAVQVRSCDGEHTVKVAQDLSGQPLADALMDQWKRDHPEANWVKDEKEKHALPSPADNTGILKGDQGKRHAYGNYTERDILTWARETEKFVAEGSRIFHSGDELGSMAGVSCDMCHPHAANTHPETYPKFQAQLGRVALLRDMIEWCLENPVRGDHLDPNGPKMRALEAYLMAQRKGVAMEYGKH
ncbi:MAG: hypothetical protein NTY19_01155 [Planctomycetota bacterium]|nr:hypothetical protein [Planctomycetota bacterium]